MADIIFICNANMCRSPMAAGILRKKLEEQKTDLTVSSMGIHAQNNKNATDFAIAVCAEHGIDISGHQSRPLMPDELKMSRLIFAMEPVQVNYMDVFVPQVADRVYLLSTWPQRRGKKKAVSDPVGRSIAVYRKTYTELEQYIDIVLPAIVAINKVEPHPLT